MINERGKAAASAETRALPSGTVTFLFTDIQGSTRLLKRLGSAYGEVLGTHRSLLRAAFEANGGVEVDNQGDSFFVAFAQAGYAVAAAVHAQRALLTNEWPHGDPVLVRMGIHTGTPTIVDGNYVGIDVHRAARIASAAHGGQIVVSAATRELVADDRELQVSFDDLGTHRLKDLERPEAIAQIVAEGVRRDFPPLKSLEPPTNIPHHAGRLVGRIAEMNELGAVLRSNDVRLVTLTGPGGTGKTRLAAAVALNIRDDFAAGAFFVDLTQARDAESVSAEIAYSLGASLDAGPTAARALSDHIGARELLLVLDNFEQARDGAPLVSELLLACPNLTVLATSRVLLSLRAEREFQLAPLSLPAGEGQDAVASSDAAGLFLQRAAEARPGFSLTAENAAAIAQICTLLDGLPLAIELAAARVKLFSPQALLQRLDDRLKLLTGGARDAHVRHQAMRTTIDWSYDLLATAERVFFRDFSVFNGGATLDAIEVVSGASFDALDLLTTLVNHNLIRQEETAEGEVRFSMLQTIREYALELLRASDAGEEVQERHGRYFTKLAERANVAGKRRTAALAEIDREHDNLRAALRWWLERSDANSGDDVRLAAAMGRYWYTHGLTLEGTSWLGRVLARAGEERGAEYADILRWLGILLEQQKDLDGALRALEEALLLYRQGGDKGGEAACLNSLGIAARNQGDLDGAEALLSQSVTIRQSIGDDAGTASGLSNLGIVAVDRGRFDDARRLIEESLSLDRARGDDWAVAAAQESLAVVRMEQGDLDGVAPLLAHSLKTFVELGDLDGVVETMEALAGYAAQQQDMLRATRLGGASDALRNRLGIPLSIVDRNHLERWLEPARRALGDAYQMAWGEGAQMTTDQAIAYSRELPQP